jgi:excisionase family DNA binding protein
MDGYPSRPGRTVPPHADSPAGPAGSRRSEDDGRIHARKNAVDAGDQADRKRRYLNIDELSTQTGLSTATIHRLKNQGKIPFYQPAGKRGRLLFPADAIERAAHAAEQPLPAPPTVEDRPHLSGPPPAWMRPTP